MNNNTFVHKYIKSLINKDDVTVDMTMGNGNDTLFLCTLSKKVIAFDIQKEAIEKTKLKTNGFNNITLINDNHINIDKYLNEKVKLFIFNLGYLPNSDSNIITNKDDTLTAFKKAYDLLIDDGYIVITFYLGHIGGKDEYYLLEKYIRENNINVIETYKEYKNLTEPITCIIKKTSRIK